MVASHQHYGIDVVQRAVTLRRRAPLRRVEDPWQFRSRTVARLRAETVDVPATSSFVALRDLLIVVDEPPNTSVVMGCCDNRLNSPCEPASVWHVRPSSFVRLVQAAMLSASTTSEAVIERLAFQPT